MLMRSLQHSVGRDESLSADIEDQAKESRGQVL